MRILFPSIVALLLSAAPVHAEAVAEWQNFRQSGGIDWLDESDWKPLTSNYTMDIGTISEAKYYVAWRESGEVGVLLLYIYANPVSPAELPGPGPMAREIVEVTLSCASATTRIHRMFLYAPDGHQIGTWFDPSTEANASSYGSDSIIGMAANRAC